MKSRIVILLFPFLFAGCHLIDDDLSVCGEEVLVTYELQLHTELSMQLETELHAESDIPVRNALQKYLEPVFTDKAKDIDLRFYKNETDELRHLIQEVINDNRTSYTIHLPHENYMHLGVANIEDNTQVQFLGAEHSATAELYMPSKEKLNPLNTGIFTARLPMNITETSRHFDVHLYMVNAAVAVVFDVPGNSGVATLSGDILGCAESFSVKDSIFSYAGARTYLMEEIPIEGGASARKRVQAAESTPTTRCLATVCMPTKDEQSWNIEIISSMSNGTKTKTTLTIDDPLKAGTLRVIRCRLGENGEVKPLGQEVGAIVELNWHEGDEHSMEPV